MIFYDNRPDPDQLLEQVQRAEQKEEAHSRKPGKLKIFFGYAPGVGKTYAMLQDAHDQLNQGADVVAGYIEPHTRSETMALVEGLEVLPPKVVPYRGIKLREFDLDAALKRRPQILLVDELAHSNAEGVRNKKRYQDIEELLAAGIDVYTTVNVQHIESLNDVIREITKVSVRETVPDYIFDYADKIKLVDIEPDELLRRFEEGKVYRADRAAAAMKHFFVRENLDTLREISMRRAADRICRDSGSAHGKRVVNTRLLVLLSTSPSAVKNVRVAARMAEAFHADWKAVYVETTGPEGHSPESNKNLRAAMALVDQMGAEVVTLYGEDAALVIAKYAEMAGITNIIVGKHNHKKRLADLFQESFEDRLISLLNDVEVHIIPDTDNSKPFRPGHRVQLKRLFSVSTVDMIKTGAVLIAATLLSMLINSLDVGSQNTAMVYILSVVLISRITSGYLYGIAASVIGVLAFNMVFTYPYFTFDFLKTGYPITFIIMLLIALITSALTVRIKEQVRSAASREQRTQVLYDLSKRLLATRGLENIVELTNWYIVRLFHRSVVFYTAPPSQGEAGRVRSTEDESHPELLEKEEERAVAQWVFVNKKRAGAGTDTLMGAGAFYMPILSQGEVLGVLGISCTKGLIDQDTRIFLRMIASQVAMALERQRLSDEQSRRNVEAEREAVRGNLLRAVSHDLKSPLVSILQKSTDILRRDGEDKQQIDRLAVGIQQESKWLVKMVGNLLASTRIQSGETALRRIPEQVSQVVTEAVARVSARYPNRAVSTRLSSAALTAPMDATLIEQVLINLMENAIQHSGDDSVITLRAFFRKGKVVFEVIDRGEGIPPQELSTLFEGSGSYEGRVRALGTGLSICKSIVQAHNGEIGARNNANTGATVFFSLPCQE